MPLLPSGGLMQLVAYGAQDVILTSQPQISFFREHTPTQLWRSVRFNKVINKYDLTECCICLSNYKPEDKVMLGTCGHFIHKSCGYESVKQCPYCREPYYK